MCVFVCAVIKEACAVQNNQALCWLCNSVMPTKSEQISQGSSESVRGFALFILCSRFCRSRLMSCGSELVWVYWFNKSWHVQTLACVQSGCIHDKFHTKHPWHHYQQTAHNEAFQSYRELQCGLTCFVNFVNLFEHCFVPILGPVHRLQKEK